MEVTGTIKKIYYAKSDWAAIAVQGDDGKTYRAAGQMMSPAVGLRISLAGEIITTKYGEQLDIKSAKILADDTPSGIEAYLSSGFIKGVGSKRAHLIVERFGAATAEIIEKDPQRLSEIPGITTEKAIAISDAFIENRECMKIVELLGQDATLYQIRSIYDKYGTKSVEKLKENPYNIIYDLDGFGFKKADMVAAAMGIKDNDPRRIGAAITYVLKTLSSEGHCFCRTDVMEGYIRELIPSITIESLVDVITEEVKNGHLVVEKDKIYTKPLWSCETETAKIIANLVKLPALKSLPDIRIQTAIKRVEDRTGFPFDTHQKEAILFVTKNRFGVITGGPGTGKTTVIQGIIEVWNDRSTILMVAPTGRASKRMSEVTGLSASTIHRLLLEFKLQPSKFKTGHFLVIADEASMMDLFLAHDLLSFVNKTQSALILIGDIDQLPPIGPGNFFRDMVRSVCVPSVRLEISFRQSGRIATNAKKINAGEGLNSYAFDDTFSFLPATKSNLQDLIVNTYQKLLSQYSPEEICCITPIRKDTKNKTRTSSADALNLILRDIVNPKKPDTKTVGFFRVGDRVMQTVNDQRKLVMNGDCGTIIEVVDDIVIVQMDDGRKVEYIPAETKQFVLAYATTVHKSQGSEYEAVIVIQCMEHYYCRLLQRSMLYTAVTRAKKQVVLIGEEKAINIAVKTIPNVTRNTQLRERIGKEVSK